MAKLERMRAHQDLIDFGNRILNEARTELYIHLRFMARALDSLGYTMDLATQSMGTDARTIHYNPNFVFALFLESPQKLDRLYLHILLHCIFRHMFSSDQYEDQALWDLAADIQVESVLDSMDYDIINRPAYPFREEWYERLRAECRVLSAERIYHYFHLNKPDLDTLQMLTLEFHKCDHQFWKRMEDPAGGGQPEIPEDILNDTQTPPDANAGAPDADGSDATDPENPENPAVASDTQTPPAANAGAPDAKCSDATDSENPDHPAAASNASDARTPDSPPAAKPDPDTPPKNGTGALAQVDEAALDEQWKDTAERLQTELTTFGAEASDKTGSLAWVLAAQYRQETDFRDFLEKLTVLREVTHVDPDSFDYGYYNYGMEVYGNMPLIEENEFREERRISDFVIAIDTSASTEQGQVQRFLDETAAILRRRTNFFQRIRVHLILCDDRVQEDIVLTKPEEIEDYAAHFEMKGGYGTDFRPVFQYVEKLRTQGALPELRGLMYFTDGHGPYPTKPTDYQTAFVYDPWADIDDQSAPDWALKLYLKDSDTPARSHTEA